MGPEGRQLQRSMRWSSTLLKFAACGINGVFIPVVIVFGMLWAAADIGVEEARQGQMTAFLLAAAAAAVIAALLTPAEWKILDGTAYAISLGYLAVSGWFWLTGFNSYSRLWPPTETYAFLLLGLISLAALATNKPDLPVALVRHRSLRYLTCLILLVGFGTGLYAGAVFFSRVQAQLPYARHFQDLGGGVRWENGRVVSVYLKNTETRDEDLRLVEHFPMLRSLDLSGTRVSGEGLAHIAELDHLDSLYLDHTDVGDRGLKHLSGLTELRNLWLHGTHVTDRGLRHLETLKKLEYLDLGGTEVTDAGLRHLHGMKQLYYLHVPDTEVSDEAVRQIAREIPGLRAYNGRVEAGE